MDKIKYQSFEIQHYLISKYIYPKLAKEIFRWRTRMHEFKINFKNKYENTTCKLKCLHEDSQENILSCPVLLQSLPNLQINNIKYLDIFSTNVDKVYSAAKIMSKLLECRTILVEKAQDEEAQDED